MRKGGGQKVADKLNQTQSYGKSQTESDQMQQLKSQVENLQYEAQILNLASNEGSYRIAMLNSLQGILNAVVDLKATILSVSSAGESGNDSEEDEEEDEEQDSGAIPHPRKK